MTIIASNSNDSTTMSRDHVNISTHLLINDPNQMAVSHGKNALSIKEPKQEFLEHSNHFLQQILTPLP
jgi:hypothetical protein